MHDLIGAKPLKPAKKGWAVDGLALGVFCSRDFAMKPSIPTN
jgi:hypothetical protein